jgi:uncharacterized protein YcaQ
LKISPLPLTPAQARRIWLHAQRLDTAEPFGSGPQATPAAVAHLGYLQIDTIHVIERSHHHILHSRIPSYRARTPAAGAKRRQNRIRILDACAVVHPDREPAVFCPAQRWNWVGGRASRAHRPRVEDALHTFEKFQLARAT